MTFLPVACCAVLLFSGCSKMPESETAKKIGAQPKQIIDQATSEVEKAMQKGIEQRQAAEKKE